MEPDLSRIDSRKEISAYKWEQYKRRRHDGNRGKQRGLAVMQNRAQCAGVTILDPRVSLIEAVIDAPEDRAFRSSVSR
jgi:hypothetical protein